MGVDTESMRMEARFAGKGNPRYPAMLLAAADEIDALRAEVERATSVLTRIAEELGPMGDGDPCPVCHTYRHKGWCWYPALVEWDKQQAARTATSKEPPCKP